MSTLLPYNWTNCGKLGFRGTIAMTLGEYVRQLMRGRSYRDVVTGAKAAGAYVARGTIHGIVSGDTEKPNPETLEALARYFGKTEEEQRAIYQELMTLAGYMEFLPLTAEEERPEQPLTRAQALKQARIENSDVPDIAREYGVDIDELTDQPDRKENHYR